MAELLQLKRLKDLKVVGVSIINGNIKLDDVETTVYTHPNTHSADIITDGTTNKAYTSIEKTKLLNIKENATKVETSTINGNIKINGVESNVYNQPLRKLNSNWMLHDGNNLDIIITKGNMNDIIYINNENLELNTYIYNVILSNDVMVIDENFVYTVLINMRWNYDSYLYLLDSNRNEIIAGMIVNNQINSLQTTTGQVNVVKSNGVYSYYNDFVTNRNIFTDVTYYLSNHTNNTSNPHNVTATQVGLENVPNVITNNQIPTYSIASSDTYLSSGETLSIAFGKIARSVSSLINHLLDNVKHITSTERTNWNNNTTSITTNTTNIATLNDFSLPVKQGNVTITIPANNGDFTYLLAHSLGYKPSRVEVYVRDDGVGFRTPFPFTKASAVSDTALGFSTLGRIGIDATNLKITVMRKLPYISNEESYTIDYYIYK